MNTEEGVTDAAPEDLALGNDNLSQEDLLNALAEREDVVDESESEEETDSPEPEDEGTEEEPESEEEEEEETEEEDDPEEDPDSDELEETEQGQVDLSKFDIDWDNLSEDEAKAINKKLGGAFHRRLDKLTARAKSAEEKLEQYKQDNPKPEAQQSNSLSDIPDLDDLQKKEQSWTRDVRDLNRVLRRDDQIDDETGDEFLYEEDGKRYTREDVEGWLETREGQLDQVADRRKFLVEKERAEEEADLVYPEFSDPDNPLSEVYEKLQEDPTRAPIFQMPDAKMIIGDAMLGRKVRLEAANKKSKTATKKKGTTTPRKPKNAGASQGVKTPRVNATKKKKLALATARKAVDNGGGREALAALFELQDN